MRLARELPDLPPDPRRRDAEITGVLLRAPEYHYVYASAHWFRHTLNTNRKNEADCPLDIRQNLLNHANPTAEAFYAQTNLAKARATYLQYHPYWDF